MPGAAHEDWKRGAVVPDPCDDVETGRWRLWPLSAGSGASFVGIRPMDHTTNQGRSVRRPQKERGRGTAIIEVPS